MKSNKKELINTDLLEKLISDYWINQNENNHNLPVDTLIKEINIIDPLSLFASIKPLIIEELNSAVMKAVKNIEIQNFSDIKNLSSSLVKNSLQLCREYVAVSALDKIDFIKMTDIMYCKAEGKYTRFFLSNGETVVSSRNIGDYELRILDINNFFRVHNSYIVNMRYLSRINKLDGTSCEMINGEQVPVSKRRQEDFIKYIKLKE